MFLDGRSRGWDTCNGQHCQGPFIMLFQHKWDFGKEPMPRELRILIRSVKYSQLGNFMMGRVEIKIPDEIVKITLSGPFGGDNLPMAVACDAEDDGNTKATAPLWLYLHPVPTDVADQFWCDEGSNEVQCGGRAIHDWALPRYAELRKLRFNNDSGKQSPLLAEKPTG